MSEPYNRTVNARAALTSDDTSLSLQSHRRILDALDALDVADARLAELEDAMGGKPLTWDRRLAKVKELVYRNSVLCIPSELIEHMTTELRHALGVEPPLTYSELLAQVQALVPPPRHPYDDGRHVGNGLHPDSVGPSVGLAEAPGFVLPPDHGLGSRGVRFFYSGYTLCIEPTGGPVLSFANLYDLKVSAILREDTRDEAVVWFEANLPPAPMLGYSTVAELTAACAWFRDATSRLHLRVRELEAEAKVRFTKEEIQSFLTSLGVGPLSDHALGWLDRIADQRKDGT